MLRVWLAADRPPAERRRIAMRRWTVKDVMTEDVVSITETMAFKEIAELLAQHRVSAVPVVDSDKKVIGVVSEADLLHKMEFSGLEPQLRILERKQRRVARTKAAGDVARDLMSSPAVTIGPDASLSEVAILMDDEHVKRLPVVDEQGTLHGIVSRSDLLRVYLRTDGALRDEIKEQVLRRTLWIDPETMTVDVKDGIVTLGGTADRRSTAQIIVRMTETVGGVVEVVDKLAFEYDDTADLNRPSY
jgi:CBS domain-containing protein